MKRSIFVLAAVAGLTFAANGARGGVVVVSSFAANTNTPGAWGLTDTRPGGTSSIVGGAPAGDPLGPGAALLTTDSTNASKAEVGVANNYGIAGTVISTINLDYSYYKAATSGNAESAPEIKLTFSDPTYSGPGDGYVTLVYEPYWNSASHPGSSTPVATDTWLTSGTIDATHGLFWEDGGFGQPNEGGGPPLHTLADWLTTFDSSSGGAFSSATLVSVEMGMGSYQPSQTGYFDDVAINGTAQPDTTYNFEPVGVPLPASAWSGLALLGGLGLFNCVKRRSMQSV